MLAIPLFDDRRSFEARRVFAGSIAAPASRAAQGWIAASSRRVGGCAPARVTAIAAAAAP